MNWDGILHPLEYGDLGRMHNLIFGKPRSHWESELSLMQQIIPTTILNEVQIPLQAKPTAYIPKRGPFRDIYSQL